MASPMIGHFIAPDLFIDQAIDQPERIRRESARGIT